MLGLGAVPNVGVVSRGICSPLGDSARSCLSSDRRGEPGRGVVGLRPPTGDAIRSTGDMTRGGVGMRDRCDGDEAEPAAMFAAAAASRSAVTWASSASTRSLRNVDAAAFTGLFSVSSFATRVATAS